MPAYDDLNVQDRKDQIKHTRNAKKRIKALSTRLIARSSYETTREAISDLENMRSVQNFLNSYAGEDKDGEGNPRQRGSITRNRNKLLRMLAKIVTGEATFNEIEDELTVVADKGFEFKTLSEPQQSLREALSVDIRQFLPRNLVLNVDKAGQVSGVTERVGNQIRSLKHKHSILVQTIGKYNTMLTDIKKELSSAVDEKSTLNPLLTIIMLETGIRVGGGRPGKTIKRLKDGSEVEVITYGLTELRPSHIKFLKTSDLEIKVHGKYGKEMLYNLSDREVISALKPYMVKATADAGMGLGNPSTEPKIFTGLNGWNYTYSKLNLYIDKKYKQYGMKPHDFRMLYANRRLFAMMSEQQEQLHEEVKALVDAGTQNIQEEVATRVTTFINDAIRSVADDLHHSDMGSAIDYYITPNFVLNFLNQGYIVNNIEDAVKQGYKTVSFDIQKFIDVANLFGTDSYPLRRATDLSQLLQSMDDEMGEVMGEVMGGVDLESLLNEMDDEMGKVASPLFRQMRRDNIEREDSKKKSL